MIPRLTPDSAGRQKLTPLIAPLIDDRYALNRGIMPFALRNILK